MSMAHHKHNFGETIDAQGSYYGDLLKIALYRISNAGLASATAVHAAVTLTEAVQTVTTGITNPDVPRNVTVKGNQAGVTGDVVITGTNMADEVITETIAANAATEVVGSKAFKTVTSIQFPVLAGAGDTISIGKGSKLGVPYKLFSSSQIHHALFDNAAETLAASAVSSTVVESNTVTTTTALNGAKDLDLFIFVK